jgi:hypothetical protein
MIRPPRKFQGYNILRLQTSVSSPRYSHFRLFQIPCEIALDSRKFRRILSLYSSLNTFLGSSGPFSQGAVRASVVQTPSSRCSTGPCNVKHTYSRHVQGQHRPLWCRQMLDMPDQHRLLLSRHGYRSISVPCFVEMPRGEGISFVRRLLSLKTQTEAKKAEKFVCFASFRIDGSELGIL